MAVLRTLFPYIAGAAALALLVWALTFAKLPPADLTFVNGEEVRTVDPAKATGQPEGRILDAIFEGLLRTMPDGEPDADGLVPMKPDFAAAERYEISDDLLTYTFYIRENARWSNGDPVTAHDFHWSWRRTLHPETATEYGDQLTSYVAGTEKYNDYSRLEEGDRVEVELRDRPGPRLRPDPDQLQNFPQGTLKHGLLRGIVKPPEPKFAETAAQRERDAARSLWESRWIYLVELKPRQGKTIDWDAPGTVAAFCRGMPSQFPRGWDWRGPAAEFGFTSGEPTRCHQVLYDWDSAVGVKVIDDRTLAVTLKHPTPYLPWLVAFYPLYPVNRRCVEDYGSPDWTKAENIVTNGPYTIEMRRLRDRLRLKWNEHHWDAANVELKVVDALAAKGETTYLNLYTDGQADWITDVPNAIIGDLQKRKDFYAAPGLITYFYRLNTRRPPLNDPRVRQALNLAIDKRTICDQVVRGGQKPARSICPPGMQGYHSPHCGEYNPAEAANLLAAAGFPGGKGFPRLEILFNTHERHQEIAEVIQQQWKDALGIDVALINMEWGTYLDTVHKENFSIARAGWVGDYPDPNTFLDMFVTEGPNNNTNWSNSRYDKIILELAPRERDAEKRAELLHEAEQILMDELPIIPIYFDVSRNMVHEDIEGWFPTLQDTHPIFLLKRRPTAE